MAVETHHAKGEKSIINIILRTSDRDKKHNDRYGPLKDHSTYKIEFLDRHIEELTANIFAKDHMISTWYLEYYTLLSEITDHIKSSKILHSSDRYLTTKSE